MFLLKLKYIIIPFILCTFLICTKTHQVNDVDLKEKCGMSYPTSEMFFEDDTKLVFNLRFIYFADSINETQINYDSLVKSINLFFEYADISFIKRAIDTVVSSSFKREMPSYVVNNFKYFKNDNYLTIYIYGDDQPAYVGDDRHIVGAAGGIGSNFLAIRKEYATTTTIFHELFHCFSLSHTQTPTNTNGYDFTSDKVCDTRYIYNLEEDITEACTYIGEEVLTDEEIDQVTCNIMSYNPSKCRTCYTEGQVRKVRFYIHESPMMRMCIHSGLRKLE